MELRLKMQLCSKEENNKMHRAGCCMVSRVMEYDPAIKLLKTHNRKSLWRVDEVRVRWGGDEAALTDSDRANRRLPRDG